jgi:predicted AAA+ superfamily ATPase
LTFKRHILANFEEWKHYEQRKPLILRGARQVGKTTLVMQFAQTYKHQILLNLEKDSDMQLFEDIDDIKTLVDRLLLANNIPSKELSNTLLFIDEIQESPKAIQQLRYLYEDIPDLHVIAASSLLEFALHKVKSFPVGRVEYLYMFPLNFAEYLDAINHAAAEQLKKIPPENYVHKIMLDLFNRYAIIGGMPEVVQTYIQKQTIADLPKVYESIWGTYQNDVEKYTNSEVGRKVIKHIMSSAPLYVDQRIKFQNFGNSNYKSREVSEAMRQLDQAKVIQLIYPSTGVEPPIRADLKKSPRLQFLDTGIVNYTLDIQSQMLGVSDLSDAFKGAIIPHLITQELLSLNTISSHKPHFWVREKKQSSAEVDLIVNFKSKVIPIEIKSGSTGSLKSLHQFIDMSPHPYAIRIYSGEFKVENHTTSGGKPYLLMNLPYYLGTKIPEYLEYFVKNFGL